MNKSQVILKKGKNDSILRKHPWVFSGAVKEIYGNPQEGDIVDVIGAKGEYLGAGHFQQGSIQVRLLTFRKEEINRDFFKKRLLTALQYRKSLGLTMNELGAGNAWRLVYGEADMLSGLIIDVYNGVAVVQPHSPGFLKHSAIIADILMEMFDGSLKAVVLRSKEVTDNDESKILIGTLPQELIIHEYGSRFIVDVVEGQKTGFFIDQRENRKLLSEYSKDRRVLNMFCYSGGFSVAALKGGATMVHSVDASASAIQLAEENLRLNGYDPQVHRCIVSDAFDFLQNSKDIYEIIILDPPAYAKHVEARHRAVKGYQRLNVQALSVIQSGGFIFTFSCSQVVDKRLFESTIMSAAIISGRNVRVVQELTHSPCHAYAITHPEGKYLKGLLLYVE